MKTDIRKIVMAAMIAALCCVATMVIRIPSPFKGYLNLGDCIVLLAGWTLSPYYAFFAAGIGSALADVFSGYAVYAPATFVIKGAMALAAYFLFRALHERVGNTASRVIAGTAAEIVMILGYFVFEGLLYGFAPSAVNIPANAVQGVVGLAVGVVLMKIFDKTGLPGGKKQQ